MNGESPQAPSLPDHYRDYYGGDRQRLWREIGAVQKAENIVVMADAVPHGSIVEIGAGDGSVLARLDWAGFGREYVALEISKSGVDQIRSRPIARLRDAMLFDGDRVPLPDKSFDLAILSHVVEHVENPRILLREAGRIAGHVFVEVPLEYNRGLGRDFAWTATGHINAYSPKLIRHLLQSSGLTVLSERATNPPREVYQFHAGRVGGAVKHAIKSAVLGLAPTLATRLYTYHYAILCRA